MTLVEWVLLAVIVATLLFVVRGIYLLRRQLMELSRAAAEWVRARPWGLVFATTLSVLAGVLLVWKAPEWHLASLQAVLPPEQYLELQNSYRATIVQALGGLALLIGLYLTWRRIVALERAVGAWLRAVPWGLIVAVFLAWKVPIWQLSSRAGSLTPEQYLELQNAYRATVVQGLGGLVLLIGIYLTWRRVAATEQQVEVAREEQITERFTRAIDQLGSEKLEVRLGGIYALERIARDSERDHWPIMEVLTAYVRKRSPAAEVAEDGTKPDPTPVKTDIQAILTVIGRRKVDFDPPQQRLDLSRTNLTLASLPGAHLAGANLLFAQLFGADLSAADLSGANLSKADLSQSDLSDAHLVGAYLFGAELVRACLRRTDLRGVNCGFDTPFVEANVRGARFHDAPLDRADLRGVDLSRAIGLTREQIKSAITNETTILPDYLKEGGEGEPEVPAEGGEAEG
jgi:uncharacterized protein YjbI with pentapeptide repeats